MSEAGDEASASAAGEVPPTTGPPSAASTPSASEFDEGEQSEAEDYTTPLPSGSEEEGEGATQLLQVESSLGAEAPSTPAQGREDAGELSEMSELLEGSEAEDLVGFSEYEQTESERDFEEVAEDLIHPSQSGIAIISTKIDQMSSKSSTAPSSIILDHKEKTPPPEPVKRKQSIDQSDEELVSVPVPTMKPNKVISKLYEPKYQLWPVKIFECENIYKIMTNALPRFFPRNFPYHPKTVSKRINMLAQYLQRKAFQMGHDRRKLLTVVRYHQKSWNGHKAVVRWLWCMETDAMVTYAHQGEGFVISAAVIGLYMD